MLSSGCGGIPLLNANKLGVGRSVILLGEILA